MSNPTISPSEIIFPHDETHPSLTQLLSTLKRSTLSVHNRLTSIEADSHFVRHVAADRFPGRPLIANERCGSWYMPPDSKDGSAYFKSTDGHERAWKFSTRRLNLHLLKLIEEHDGVIIVDSTRRGKRMPDALSTTIPIWCTVINLALLPDHPLSSHLHLAPSIPPQTHSAITSLLPTFLQAFQDLNLPAAAPATLTKPLRPLWITQDSTPPAEPIGPGDVFDDYRPVICCTASRRVVGGTEADQAGYIQGAADDTENWAHGLTPLVFWNNLDELLAAAEAELPDTITRLVAEHDSQQRLDDSVDRIQKLTGHVCVSPLPLRSAPRPIAAAECRILLLPSPPSSKTELCVQQVDRTTVQVHLGTGKVASRNLRTTLPEICEFARRFLGGEPPSTTESGTEQSDEPEGTTAAGAATVHRQVLIACETGRDISVGVGLAIDCLLFDTDGKLRLPDGGQEAAVSFNKALVKTRLGAIMARNPDLTPSRATLQAVNSFLMDGSR